MDDMNAEDRTALEIVRLGYAVDDPTDRRRCLGFTASFHTLEGAQAAVRAIGGYNDFDGEAVAEALAAIAEVGGTVGGPRFSIGRENSPCIYVAQLESYAGGSWPASCARVVAILENAAADEVDEVGTGAGSSYGTTIRAWWD